VVSSAGLGLADVEGVVEGKMLGLRWGFGTLGVFGFEEDE